VCCYHEAGGERLLPALEGQSMGDVRLYSLTDTWDGEASPAEIVLKAVSDSMTEVTLRPNASELWGLRLGDPQRAVLGRTAYLAGDTSQRIAGFLQRFADHITQVKAEAAAVMVVVKPDKPSEPATCNLEDWFGYYHECQEAGFKMSLKDIAEQTGYNYDYVRQKHAEYMADRSS